MDEGEKHEMTLEEEILEVLMKTVDHLQELRMKFEEQKEEQQEES